MARPTNALMALCVMLVFSAAWIPAAYADVLLRGNGPDPDSLDPHKARTNEAFNILRDLYEGLTSLAPDGSAAPGVAREWSISPDGKTYTFKLRDSARWSNGDRVVAAHFVAGLRHLVDPATACEYAQLVDVIVQAREIIAGRAPVDTLGVAALDESTLQISLTGPAPYLPSLLTHPSTFPIHPAGPRHQRVYNGAFVLKEWVQGSHVLATRNSQYWNNSATRLEGIKYLHIPDESAEFIRYRADDLHITAAIPRAQLESIESTLKRELHVTPQLATYFYGFNLARAPFKDNPKLRQALSMVIDRERLARSILRVGEVPAYGWMPAGIPGYRSQSFSYKSESSEQRLATARRLYAEAGFSPQNPLKFELRYNAGETHARVAVAVAAMWKEALGVQANMVAVEFKSLLADIDRGQVEVFRSSWIGDYNDPYTFAQYFKSDFGINLPRYRNPQYDDLLNRAASQTDAQTRGALLEQAEVLMLSEHPIIPLYFYVNKHLVKPQVRGWYDNLMNVVYSKDLALSL